MSCLIGDGMVGTPSKGEGACIREATKGPMTSCEETNEDKGGLGEILVDRRPTKR